MITEKFLQKLEGVVQRFREVEARLAEPEVATDPKELARLGKLHAELAEIVQAFEEYQRLQKSLQEARDLLENSTDADLVALAREELEQLEPELERKARAIQRMLLPKDPHDERNVIMEIRAGTGGEEAALFAAELFRLYARYAERRGWQYEVLDATPSDLGGYKEIIFSIQGKGAYSQLKYESGVHRVQRVPITESGGRIHTSAATVAVLPEVEEVEVEIKPEDLEIETFRASGPGGQHMQKNETAVRILHKPTGLVVACQDERSQLQNKERALRLLRARLYELEWRAQQQQRDALRRTQIGSGDRSEKIRTYNFPERRITDHRVGLTLYNLEEVLDGDLQPFIDALLADEQARLLEELR